MTNHRVAEKAIACLIVLALDFSAVAQAQTAGLVEFFAGGKLHQGVPLVDLANQMIVMGRDGSLFSLDPHSDEARIQPIAGRYKPVSAVELRNQLRAEFGRDFEVLSTQHFLVVQPRGRGDLWPNLFEQSHRSFLSYMSKRGVTTRTGRFPMVAVVYPDQQSMYSEFRRLKIEAPRISGLYSNNSNRVMTHDGGRQASIAATVRHEAAHQSAFNSGIHSRVNDTPKWITEGIGEMFEPPAMTQPRGGSRRSDRVNRGSSQLIKTRYKGRRDIQFSRDVMQLVSDDTMFESEQQVNKAYAVSWAMMFYLAERHPTAFANILNHTTARPPFIDYPRASRVRDFERIVGADTMEFSKRVSSFVQSL